MACGPTRQMATRSWKPFLCRYVVAAWRAGRAWAQRRATVEPWLPALCVCRGGGEEGETVQDHEEHREESWQGDVRGWFDISWQATTSTATVRASEVSSGSET